MNEQPENTEKPESTPTTLNFEDILGQIAGGPARIEPSADQRAAATGIFQLYTAWIDAGFSRAEALQIIVGIIASGIGG